jgi:hypothetical protein
MMPGMKLFILAGVWMVACVIAAEAARPALVTERELLGRWSEHREMAGFHWTGTWSFDADGGGKMMESVISKSWKQGGLPWSRLQPARGLRVPVDAQVHG